MKKPAFEAFPKEGRVRLKIKPDNQGRHPPDPDKARQQAVKGQAGLTLKIVVRPYFFWQAQASEKLVWLYSTLTTGLLAAGNAWMKGG